MKIIFIALLALFNITLFSQEKEIKDLEKFLRSYRLSEEHYGIKHGQAYQLLSLDKYNDIAIYYLLSSYRKTQQKDSIPFFLNQLIENNPSDIEPYLIREQYKHFQDLSDTCRINNLKKALLINPKEERINYELGKLYYTLFIEEYNKNKIKENLDSYAKNSTKHFTVVCEENEINKERLKFPLLQLAYYLENEKNKKIYENYFIQNSHFPISAFVILPDDWKTNYSVNVIKFSTHSDIVFLGIEYALSKINWYSKHLSNLQEPIINNSLPNDIYRFTYLRSFHNPIVIGLENNNDDISIYWKIANGAGGYNTGEIIENKKKKLTKEDWIKFEQQIKDIEFWGLSSVKDNLSGLDGAEWILEGKTDKKYHVVNRWGGKEISFLCRSLINLTDIKIDTNDIY